MHSRGDPKALLENKCETASEKAPISTAWTCQNYSRVFKNRCFQVFSKSLKNDIQRLPFGRPFGLQNRKKSFWEGTQKACKNRYPKSRLQAPKKAPKSLPVLRWNGVLFSRSFLGGSQVPPGYHFGLILVPFLKDFLYFSLPCSPLLACLRKRQARQILCQKIGDSCLPPGHASPKIEGSCPPSPKRQISQNCSWALDKRQQSGTEFATALPPSSPMASRLCRFQHQTLDF